MPHRIAVGSIFTECNHFCGTRMTLADFERSELRRGDEMLSASTGTIGGVLQVLGESQCEIVPLLAASACPGGPLTADCYSQLKTELIDRLRTSLPVAGVILPLHGSATAENAEDLEGDLLAAVRSIVGEHIPIVATLDLHAHVTEAMVQNADGLVAWETYPHRDAFSTGQRGARLLVDTLAGRCRPTMAMAKVPVIVGAIHGGTDGEGPFADCMRLAKQYELRDGVLSTSMFLVHPYLDLPDMGGGGLVITDNDSDAAVRLAVDLATTYWHRRHDLEPTLWSPEAAIRQARNISGGPILLIDMSDCCGGGAAGDSIASLKALLAAGIRDSCLAAVVDPAAAASCHAGGIGSTLTLSLGHHVDPRWGSPIEVTGAVAKLSDGQFRYTGGIFDGQVGNMGPSAVLRIGSIDVLIASYPTYDWNDEQFRSVGLDARRAKFIVVKNPMNFHMAYGSFATATYFVNTPGPTPPTLKSMPFRRLKRPYFPADDIADVQPTIYKSRGRTWRSAAASTKST